MGVELRTVVTFIEVPDKVLVEQVKPAPRLLPEFPDDMFYPFEWQVRAPIMPMSLSSLARGTVPRWVFRCRSPTAANHRRRLRPKLRNPPLRALHRSRLCCWLRQYCGQSAWPCELIGSHRRCVKGAYQGLD